MVYIKLETKILNFELTVYCSVFYSSCNYGSYLVDNFSNYGFCEPITTTIYGLFNIKFKSIPNSIMVYSSYNGYFGLNSVKSIKNNQNLNLTAIFPPLIVL